MANEVGNVMAGDCPCFLWIVQRIIVVIDVLTAVGHGERLADNGLKMVKLMVYYLMLNDLCTRLFS